MKSFRIATWNLERPTQKGWTKNQRRLEQIRKIDADVWVLTETNQAIDLHPDYESVVSVAWKNHHQLGENLTTLWSRWKILQRIATFNPIWAVCAEVESPFGAMIIYGTVITYANDKGIGGSSKRWEEHRRSIQQHHEDWQRIQKQFPKHLICIAGDFNQSRDRSGWYEDKQSVEMLSAALQDLSLVCVTEENFQKTGLSRSTVDHICLSQSLVLSTRLVGAWEGKTSQGKMSDHNGVFVDLTSP
ncbi:endonuclease/exonuclease/phosphatase family protein [Pseudanabaenaceae cyanobacterium LEGE 13415]|nr:endonuclease/exonuclease/phosphatase family protein [Pseudanabaenaceae cyanobacterium LEGE 13415]